MCSRDSYVLAHLNDVVVERGLEALASQERGAMALGLAHLAELDARRLYLPAGYPSLYEYCLRKLRWSEQSTLKRIRAARTARSFPAIFDALAEGRLHLTAVVVLAPYLCPENADELLGAASHRTRAEIELLLAARFPRPDAPLRLETILTAAPRSPVTSCSSPSSGTPCASLSPGTVATHRMGSGEPAIASLFPEAAAPQPSPSPGTVGASLSPGTVEPSGFSGPRGPASRLAPLAADRFVLQVTIGKDTYETLRAVQELLGHRVPASDIAQVLDRALNVLKRQLEKQKFAATAKPRAPRAHRTRTRANPRYVSAHVKRAVYARDGGQCTFVNPDGERCPARRDLEFDHIEPVARGGRATVAGMRLLCRGHNQYEAERRFGVAFMDGKRQMSRSRSPRATSWREAPGTDRNTPRPVDHGGSPGNAGHGAAAEAKPAGDRALLDEAARDIMAGLRGLGFRAAEARRAVEFSRTIGDATLEDRMLAAIKYLCPRGRLAAASGSSA